MTMLTDGFELKNDDLGDELGHGSYKGAFIYKADENFVITKSHLPFGYSNESDEMFEEERVALHRLHNLGIGVSRILATGTVLGDRGQYPANLMKRYAASNRSCSAQKIASVLNERSVASLVRLHERLMDLDMSIWDLQFLVATDGEVVVNDPGRLHFNVIKQQHYTIKENWYNIATMISAAEYSIYRRANGMTVDGLYGDAYGYRDSSRSWFKTSGRYDDLRSKYSVLEWLDY